MSFHHAVYMVLKCMRFDLSCLPQVGRGTSTHDGLAIAYATLRHLAAAKVPTMFVTHYPLLSRLADELAGVANYHMAFVEEDEQEQAQEETAGAGANTGFFFFLLSETVATGMSVESLARAGAAAAAAGSAGEAALARGCAAASASSRVLFLYKLVPGVAHRSFGLNVARLAELPGSVLQLAASQVRPNPLRNRCSRVCACRNRIDT